ncbi:hypothetical protein AR158_c013L [Paramecium bursaria Chlorella virus AR158]|uniref:hypothetical protein n=1 Tax=Paramecium bursaria Chlorella virus AR158 TaxID=380598 RepID=UPI00015AA710|nr:hypothetical protein AR158_c013L [Paramecium bursaria Chlorella virus AR158]ABU43559.1 hypothetical protein AR158_c013L [Paramecium bursaria Chlorella virus AR158]
MSFVILTHVCVLSLSKTLLELENIHTRTIFAIERFHITKEKLLVIWILRSRQVSHGRVSKNFSSIRVISLFSRAVTSNLTKLSLAKRRSTSLKR